MKFSLSKRHADNNYVVTRLKGYTTGANLTYMYLAPQGQFFIGAKSFIGTTEMQRFFVFKDKRVCTMEKMHGFPGNR